MKHHFNNEIIDTVNLNNYGIIFHSTKTIEDFQKLSNMSGEYTKEYQVHYINVIGRINSGHQQLDIAIPLVMYNYEQYVAGASVEFHLDNVTKANDKAIELAKKKFDEFSITPMFKTLSESMGITNWMIQGFNSIHAHPSGINHFSGIDYNKNASNPGVCFPLSSGSNIPNFASIIQHKQTFAEIIHTEYRIFNGEENKEKIYEKGRCINIIKGYAATPPPEPKKLEPGDIDNLFGVIPEQPKINYILKERKSYILLDSIEDNPILENIISELSKLWEETTFQTDTSLIRKDNIKFYKQKKYEDYVYNSNTKSNNSSLFRWNDDEKEYIEETYFSKNIQPKTKTINKKQKKYTKKEIDKCLDYLISYGFGIEDFVEFEDEEIIEQYELIKEMEKDIDLDLDDIDDFEMDEMVDQLVRDRVYPMSSLVGKSKQEIFYLYADVYQI